MSERAASPARNVEEVSVERAPDVEAPNVEPAEMVDTPEVQSCESVESPVVEAASPELALGGAAAKKDAVKSEREQKEMDYAATHNPKKATIDKLRGGHGPVFESHAAVLRGNRKPGAFKLLMQCCQKERDFVAYSEVSDQPRRHCHFLSFVSFFWSNICVIISSLRNLGSKICLDQIQIRVCLSRYIRVFAIVCCAAERF
jgi:hypothetical protein